MVVRRIVVVLLVVHGLCATLDLTSEEI